MDFKGLIVGGVLAFLSSFLLLAIITPLKIYILGKGEGDLVHEELVFLTFFTPISYTIAGFIVARVSRAGKLKNCFIYGLINGLFCFSMPEYMPVWYIYYTAIIAMLCSLFGGYIQQYLTHKPVNKLRE